LPGIAMLERAHLQIDEQVTAQHAVIEHQINGIVLIAYGDPALAGLESEPGAEFEEELLDVVEQRAFQIVLQEMRPLGQTDELQDVWVSDEPGDVRWSVHGLLSGALNDRLFIGG
jgi:hypothetical protein